MKRIVLDFLCKLEGFNTAVRSLHWNSKNLSQHKLCDDIADRLADFQDQVGEVEQSISGNLPFNKLKPVEYNVKNLKKFVEDVISDTNVFYSKVKDMGKNYIGMASDCESFLSDMQRNLYLVNFTIKEDFKRNYRNKSRMNESRKTEPKRIKITESDFRSVINEAIHNVVEKHINEIGDTPKGQYMLGKLDGRKEKQGDLKASVDTAMYALNKRNAARPFRDIRDMETANTKGWLEGRKCNEADVKGGEYHDKELNYTHFAVNKATNLIVNGWDYSGYDTDDLKSYKRDYFYSDLEDNGFNPKAYKILSFKACQKAGLDPNNQVNWSNTGVFPLFHEINMKQNGENFYDVARESHPGWFVG